MLEFQRLDAASDDFHILLRLYRHRLHLRRSELAKSLALSCDVLAAYEAPPVTHPRPDAAQLERMNSFFEKFFEIDDQLFSPQQKPPG